MARLFLIPVLIIASLQSMHAQDYRWQQRVEYTMDVHLDVSTHKVTGTQKLVYYNNSPDTLSRIYYHLFFNAFQPGSMMDVRSRTLPDPDRRIGDRISKLKEDEIGFEHVQSLKQDGKEVSYKVNQTLLEVNLAKPILPRTKTILEMKFDGQVPIQIRRCGRDNREGISYTMTQWYPKLAEYDFQGWHADQYVAREFHGVWGDFDVTISLDPKYIIGATGKLQNPEKVGYGYEKPGTIVKRPAGDISWHFFAKDVIDFAWAADPDYVHDRLQVPDGPELHFFYQSKEKVVENWKRFEPMASKLFQFLNERFGKYPFDSYSIIQGGDGGMEYPMCTMILGDGQPSGLAEIVTHESAHSWYQMTLASNELLHPWMDEGFAEFAGNEAMAAILDVDAHQSTYQSYFVYANSGGQEPASLHADTYNTNRGYRIASYNMGALFLNQLKYIIGESTFYEGMRRYYNTWKMRHPEPNDFVRVMEKVSGIQLHWFYRYWINSTRHIDYGIGDVVEREGATMVSLDRIGDLPMPVDLRVIYKDGTHELFYIATNEMLGRKRPENNEKRSDLDPWPWTYNNYILKISRPAREIESLEIDPKQLTADVNRKNNKVVMADYQNAFKDPTK